MQILTRVEIKGGESMIVWEKIEKEIMTRMESDNRSLSNPISNNPIQDAFYDGMYEAYKIMKKHIEEERR